MITLTIFLLILSVISLFIAVLLHCQYVKTIMLYKLKLANTYKQLEDIQQENKDLNKIHRKLESLLKEIELVAFKNNHNNTEIVIKKIRELIHDHQFKD